MQLVGNLQQPIDQLASVYDMSREQVVSILLEEGLLEDKRQSQSVWSKGEEGERITDLPNLCWHTRFLVTGFSPHMRHPAYEFPQDPCA